MLNKYFKYLPWLILDAFASYGAATHYAQTTFDLFFLTIVFYDCLRGFIVFTRNLI